MRAPSSRMRRVTRTVRANVARTLQLAMQGTSLSWQGTAEARPVPHAGSPRPAAAPHPPIRGAAGRASGASAPSCGEAGGADAHT